VTAVFAANDDMAVGVIRALAESGRAVPGDVSVLGFDDIPTAAYVSPALTTFRYPFEAGAARGVAALVAAIEHPDAPAQALDDPPGELIVRESTAPPSRHDESRSSAGGSARKQ
jgi:DNA-binding LacI/PurR family transcriptional regulator